MLPLALGSVLAVAVAFALLRRLDPESPVDRIVAESLILGPAMPAAALFLCSLVGIQWSRGVLFGCGALAIIPLLIGWRGWAGSSEKREASDGIAIDLAMAIPLFLLLVLLLAGYAQFAFVSAGAENDFIGIWGAKGRTFFTSGQVDWEFLSAPWRGYAHPDYPILVPLVFSAVAVATGSWSESLLGLVYPLYALGGLLLTWSELRVRSERVWIRGLGVLAVSPFVMSPWIGLADGPLALMILCALLRLSRWINETRNADLVIGATFLGLAMSTKNEGISAGVVACLMIAWMTPATERRRLVGLWPVVLIAAPWLVLRSVHGLSTDLFGGGAIGRLLGRVFDPAYLVAMGRYLVEFRPGLWLPYLVLGLTLVIWRKRLQAGDRFVVAVVLIQLAIDLSAYLITPLPLEWHVRWSWERLVSQVGAALAVVAVSLLVELARSNGRFAALVGSGPQVEYKEPDPDTDR